MSFDNNVGMIRRFANEKCDQSANRAAFTGKESDNGEWGYWKSFSRKVAVIENSPHVLDGDDKTAIIEWLETAMIEEMELEYVPGSPYSAGMESAHNYAMRRLGEFVE